MTLPAGYTMRPIEPADAEPIAAMRNRNAVALIGFPIDSADRMRVEWASPAADPREDFAIVLDAGGGVAGYLSLYSSPPFTEVVVIGVVAPEHRGRGLGSAILHELERRAVRYANRAASGERVVLHAGCLDGVPATTELLSSNGYTLVCRFELMRTEFAGPPEPAAAIPGIEIRPIADGEQALVHRCLEHAFADHFGDIWPEEQSWLFEMTAGDDYRPDLWLIARDGDAVVGAVVGADHATVDPRCGFVDQIGVIPSHRRRGIGEALLRELFVRYHAEGRPGVALYVDAESQTGATRMYERVGMRATPCFATWEKPLRTGG